MNPIPIDYKIAASIWWSMAWRTIIFGMIFGFIAGSIVGVVLSFAGHSGSIILISFICGLLVGIPLAIWVVKNALSKKHHGYSVRLVIEE